MQLLLRFSWKGKTSAVLPVLKHGDCKSFREVMEVCREHLAQMSFYFFLRFPSEEIMATSTKLLKNWRTRALEHPLKRDKGVTLLQFMVIVWVIFTLKELTWCHSELQAPVSHESPKHLSEELKLVFENPSGLSDWRPSAAALGFFLLTLRVKVTYFSIKTGFTDLL